MVIIIDYKSAVIKEGVSFVRMSFTKGLASGMLLSAAACIMILPQMDGRTRRRIDRASRKFVDRTGDIMCDIKGCMK